MVIEEQFNVLWVRKEQKQFRPYLAELLKMESITNGDTKKRQKCIYDNKTQQKKPFCRTNGFLRMEDKIPSTRNVVSSASPLRHNAPPRIRFAKRTPPATCVSISSRNKIETETEKSMVQPRQRPKSSVSFMEIATNECLEPIIARRPRTAASSSQRSITPHFRSYSSLSSDSEISSSSADEDRLFCDENAVIEEVRSVNDSGSVEAMKGSSTSSSPGRIKGRRLSTATGKESSSDDSVSRKISTVSKTSMLSGVSSKDRGRRNSINYDPDLEKAEAFLHGGGKNFSRANTSLVPVRFALKSLQISYTEANTGNNHSVIFSDLLKSSHQRGFIREESIKNLERRLETKRTDPLFSTTFYENKGLMDPYRHKRKHRRTPAQKKLARKKKIKKKTDEIHQGYVPTVLTMKQFDQEDVEKIAKTCRYLRIDPSLQEI